MKRHKWKIINTISCRQDCTIIFYLSQICQTQPKWLKMLRRQCWVGQDSETTPNKVLESNVFAFWSQLYFVWDLFVNRNMRYTCFKNRILHFRINRQFLSWLLVIICYILTGLGVEMYLSLILHFYFPDL